MANIPTTSTTLLRDLANDSQHARWSEFVTRYRPMMEAFMRERFPSLDADDVIQETLIAVWAALPSYRYVPEEKGYFHNYLTGILRNKALRQFHKDQRQAEIAEELRRSRGDAPYQSADSGRADASCCKMLQRLFQDFAGWSPLWRTHRFQMRRRIRDRSWSRYTETHREGAFLRAWSQRGTGFIMPPPISLSAF